MHTQTVVGVLVNDVESSYQAPLVDALCRHARALGVKMVFYSGAVMSTPTWFERQFNICFYLAKPAHLDGILSITSTFKRAGSDASFLQLVDSLKALPMVSLSAQVPGIPSVLVDNATGFRALVRHLAFDHGYTDFAFLGGPAGNQDAQERLRVFLDVMSEAGVRVDPRLIQNGEFNYYLGREAAERILDSGLPVRALVAANDEMALAALRVAGERGLRVPEDLVIVGVDDLQPFSVDGPGLTTVDPMTDQQVCHALGGLLSMIRGGRAPALTVVPTRAVIRQTCGCVAGCSQHDQSALGASDPLGALVASLGLSMDASVRYRGYLDRVMSQLDTADATQFDDVVLAAASDCLAQDGGVVVLQAMLHGVCQQLLDPNTLDSGQILRCSVALNRAQILVAKAQTMRAVSSGKNFGFDTRGAVNQLKRLLLSFEMHQQMESLHDALALIGLDTCIIACYEEPGYFNTCNDFVLPERARLVACLVDGHRHTDQLWQEFATEQLMPAPVWALTASIPLVVMPVFQQVGHYGYVIFGLRRPVGMSLDSVREAIASALIGALMVEEIGRARDQLGMELDRVARVSQQIKVSASHDPVTGLLNRRGFLLAVRAQAQASERRPAALIYINVGQLGRVTQYYGEHEAEFIVEQTARIFSSALRADDLVARLGEEDFVALCPDTDTARSGEICKRLEEMFDQFSRRSGKPYRLRSWVASVQMPVGEDPCPLDQLLSQFQDSALCAPPMVTVAG